MISVTANFVRTIGKEIGSGDDPTRSIKNGLFTHDHET